MNGALAVSTALALSASPLAAQGEARWVEVASDSTEVVSIDTASVTALGEGLYRIWERDVSRPSNQLRILARADFDCKLRLTRAVAIAIPGFAPTPASEEEREWTEVLPGSTYEAEWRQVCSTAGPAGTPR
jgi:hypothetical protein